MPQITCQGLTLCYDNKTILSGLSFAVNAGDYLCIVGENGSGKSTLLKTLLHLHTPTEGRVTTDKSLQQTQMGYMPQQTIVQKDFPASVAEVVLSGCLNRSGLRPFYSRTEKQIAKENMQKLGISHLSRCSYKELSGGQQQRVLLARALCATQKILLLDEPVTGLDPQATIEMYALIQQLNHSGITIIMISHDVYSAVKYASHILHIGSQKSLFYGTTPDYLLSDVGLRYLGIRSGAQ